jgi:hypothetical protein
MNKLLSIALLLPFISFAEGQVDKRNEITIKYDVYAADLKKQVSQKLEETGTPQSEKEQILEQLDQTADQDRSMIANLSEQEIEESKIGDQPFHCFYDYRYHYALTQTIISETDLEKDNIIAAGVASVFAFGIDTVLTPLSIYFAASEPHNDEVQKPQECH